jgi:hypothetical protein
MPPRASFDIPNLMTSLPVASPLARLPLLMSLWVVALVEATETPTAITQRLLGRYGSTAVRPLLAQAEAAAGQQCVAAAPPPDDVQAQIYVEDFSPIDTLKQEYGMIGYLRVCA